MIDASKLAVMLSSTARASLFTTGLLYYRAAREMCIVFVYVFFYSLVWIRVSGNQELCDTEVI